MTDPERQSVLAVHSGALGDVVLFGHLLSAMSGRVTLLAGGEKARMLAAAGVVDAALDFDALPMHEVFSETPPAACRLPGLLGRHDRTLSCFAAGDARAERRLAELAGASEATFLPTRPPADYDAHLCDLWARRLEMPPLAAPTPWAVPRAWRDDAMGILQSLGAAPDRPYVVVHPGAGAEDKCWPLERFLAVGAALCDEGAAVLFALGPVEIDRWRDGRVQRIGEAFPLLAAAALPTLAGALAGAAAYVGNDSGVSHLAAALGVPTLALFGPTDARHFRPLGRKVAVLAAGALEHVAADEVLRALRAWLAG